MLMKKTKSAISGVITGLTYSGAVMLMISVLLATINAFARKFLNTSFSWAEELCIYIVVVGVFFTLPYLTLKDDQLRINLISAMVKNQKVLKALRILFGLMETALFGMLIYYGLNSTRAARISGVTTNYLHIPKYILYRMMIGVFLFSILSWLSVIFLNKGDSFE